MQALTYAHTLMRSPLNHLSKVVRYRRVLIASTKVEVAKRYTGSLFGKLWLVLQPALLLSVYLFVYLVIFKMRFPGYSQWDYVLFVFCGLIPYIGFSEALNSSCASIKQNMNLINNILLPIELIPVRAVLISMVAQIMSLGILLLMVGLSIGVGINLLWLPLIFLLQVALLVGLSWILSAMAVLLPDVSYFVNYFLFFLMFVSPIGFKPEMVPERMRFLLLLNPIHYMTKLYRSSITENAMPDPFTLCVFTLTCLTALLLGSLFFAKFKDTITEA